jgi:tetratricopeptide (TPR) repeat protein
MRDLLIWIAVAVVVGAILLFKLRRFLITFFYVRQLKTLIPELVNALEKDPTNAQIWWNLGYVYSEIGRLDKAQICVERLESLDPENAKLLQRRIDRLLGNSP